MNRIATFKTGSTAVIIEHEGLTRALSLVVVRANPLAAAAIITAMVKQASFVHVNRDDTIAVAVGQEPGVWPEDEVENG